jgi:ATP-dependent protease HslVU (ClpYQ) peptidase subunit
MVREEDTCVFILDGLGFPFPVKGKFFAVGSGGDFAYGALGMGASAVEAVKIGCRFDVYSSGPVKKLVINKD